MKKWIKSVIQESEFCYLNLYHSDQILTIPVVYKYVRGHLKVPISILFPDLIDKINSRPQISVLITDGEMAVELSCHPKLEVSDLDANWNDYKDILIKYLPEFESNYFESKPSLRKQVLIDLKPNSITALDTDGQHMVYEMEIL